MYRQKNPSKKTSWWKDRFVTIMILPERTRRVHKIILPSFALKLSIILISLGSLFMFLMGVDYVHVLGRMAENKRLKGENFKLRQELQTFRNKVDSMEGTIDRVRNYAKKLQVLTGQEAGTGPKKAPKPLFDDEKKRLPASKDRSSLEELIEPSVNDMSMENRLELLKKTSLVTETGLSRLQNEFISKSALLRATPSLFPLAGYISSSFGWRRHPSLGEYRMHQGIDIVAEPGSPVRAPADGTVFFSGRRRGYGKVIVLNHGFGIQTLFGHNSFVFVTRGERIKRGDVIAQVGSTGRATGPHLHYEIRKRGQAVNPVPFFSTSY